MSDKPEWYEEAQAILGSKGITDNESELSPWLTDWRGRYTGKAAAMFSPASTAEVAEIVKLANRHKLALVPQGGNSGMVGGATPDETGHAAILSLRRMNQIRQINADDQLAICDGGVILQTFHEALEPHGQRFPLTLGGKGSATIGGLVSTNAGGTQVLRHGTMRALVAGVEAVLPDGSIYDGLAALKKDNRGYDLKQLLVGGEGTLGIVTAATLKTCPALVDRCVSWVGVESPQAAYRLFQFINARKSQLMEGFEIVPDSCLQAVLKHIPDTRSPLSEPTAWNALIEIVRDQPEAEDPREISEALLAEAVEQGLALDATIASNETQAEAFWKIRDSIAEAERADGPALQHDISVPVHQNGRFHHGMRLPKLETAFAGNRNRRLWSYGRRQRPFPCSRTPPVQVGHRTGCQRTWPANHNTHGTTIMVVACWRIHIRRAWHWSGDKVARTGQIVWMMPEPADNAIDQSSQWTPLNIMNPGKVGSSCFGRDRLTKANTGDCDTHTKTNLIAHSENRPWPQRRQKHKHLPMFYQGPRSHLIQQGPCRLAGQGLGQRIDFMQRTARHVPVTTDEFIQCCKSQLSDRFFGRRQYRTVDTDGAE